SPLSRVIHFYPLNPTMCQFGVRNVGWKRTGNLGTNTKERGSLYPGRWRFTRDFSQKPGFCLQKRLGNWQELPAIDFPAMGV
ncbi:hypothetical protein, partial [Microcoleus sp. F4-D5]|uniref:hypothetical protein n=1 Tax=Microcoleus sp. F4-D5 TaxID=2818760 RepID=UPI002FD5CAFA